MDEPIDAVGLGLKRGPRGAVGVALLVVIAIPITVLSTRGSECVVVPAQEPALDELAPLTPVPVKPVKTKRPSAKRNVPARAVSVAPKREAPVPQSAQTVAKTVASPEPVVEKTIVDKLEPKPIVEEELVPPPPPQPESVAKLEEAEEPERDGNGEAIARSIADAKRAAVRTCFESELKASPKLHGTVVVELDLAPPNRVNGVRVNDDLERAAFTSCVAATMRDVKFGALDEEISVSVPYVLTPAAK